MFEPEDNVNENLNKPSDLGFYALILNKLIDEECRKNKTSKISRSLKINFSYRRIFSVSRRKIGLKWPNLPSHPRLPIRPKIQNL